MKQPLIALITIISLFHYSAFASEGTGGYINAQYDVYAGGIHALKANLLIDQSEKGEYKVSLDTTTHGFLSWVAPWRGLFETEGWVIAEGDYRPRLHRSSGTWRKETEIKEYNYTKERRFEGLFIQEHNKEKRKETPEDGLTQGTTDVLSATMAVMHQIATGSPCETESDIFDGKRRFVLKYRHKDTEVLEPTRYNVYSGESVRCTVEVIPDGGAWHKKPRGWLSIQEQGRDLGTMPTVWMAAVDGQDMIIPVKVMVKTDYGTLFMHLTGYQTGDKKLVAEKRSKD